MMSDNVKTIEAQSEFRDCYRGRLKFIYHFSYLRLCKSKLLYYLLQQCCIPLQGVRIFDYAFGAGTFLYKLPKDCSIFGVELDPRVVSETRTQLHHNGYKNVDIDVVEIESWREHRLLTGPYDVVICSHILEHLDDPTHLLKVLKSSLAPNGIIVGLVPINEEIPDPHHVQVCDKGVISLWASECGLTVYKYLETDQWNYWAKRYLSYDKHPMLRKAWSISFGVLSSVTPNSLWWRGSRVFGKILKVKPTQAGFVFKVEKDD